MTSVVRDNRPVSILHRRYASSIAHGWVRFDNGWLATTCARPEEAFAPGEYEFFPAGTLITCIACLVAERR